MHGALNIARVSRWLSTVALAATALLTWPSSAAAQQVCASDMTTACANYNGTYMCPLQRQNCQNQLVKLLPPTFAYVCPINSSYACANTGSAQQCSAVACVAKPACSDGIDNDGDGKVDYPADPGCSSPSDTNETDPPPPPPKQVCASDLTTACTNNGGTYMCPLQTAACTRKLVKLLPLTYAYVCPINSSLACTSVNGVQTCAAISCVAAPACSDGIDNDGDGKIDYPTDPGCTSAQDNDEYNAPPPQCSDGVDNDGDGKIDYPADSGCSSATDNDETNAPPPPACSDGIDNDGDGKIDYPADPGCTSPTDTDEYNSPLPLCADGIDNDGDGLVDMADPGCTSPIDNDESNPPPPAACADGVDNDGDGKVDYPADPGCGSPLDDDEVDPLPPPACSDGVDNDGDGKVDYPADPGCASATDNDEYNAPPPACSDGIDNDGDGKVDYPADPGCASATDNDEYNAPLPACSDGIDNDGDGKIDFPADPGCTSAADTDETNPAPVFACSDGIDNDGDGKTDYPADPGCTSATDNDEYNAPLPACSDGIDNDGDGKIDFPADPGCTSAGDTDEPDPPPQAACSDHIDNDGDGKIDYPADPGCTSAADNSEADPPVATQCNDGVDNDHDGLIDMDDPGCSSGSDNDETNTAPPPACSDGIDNDGDGKVDYPADPGCSSPTDTDEYNAPETVYACSDGVDNDLDGLKDYPADPGCSSATDTDETDPPATGCSGTDCICGADLDGDGYADAANEQASCTIYANGSLCPLQKKACELGATGWTCPGSPSSRCINTGSGTMQCSANECVNKSSIVPVTTDPNQDFPEDNGPRDANGNCLGEIKVFAGAAKRCRKSGTQTAFQNCCTNDLPKLQDTMGEKGGQSQGDYKAEHTEIEFWKNQCDIPDQEAALLSDSGYCVDLGSYCAERWPLVGCVQRAQGFCCFGSMLAKIIQTQGRAQIPAMGGFGAADAPNCRGFTMEEFQSLDFSKIDMSEYYETLRFNSQSTMQTMTQQGVTNDFPH